MTEEKLIRFIESSNLPIEVQDTLIDIVINTDFNYSETYETAEEENS